MKLLITLVCLLLLQIFAEAQYITRKAASQQEVYHYSAAAALYEKGYNKRPNAANARAVANAHRQLRNYPASEIWYGRLAVLPEATATDLYYYGLALQQNGKYDAAKQQLNRCHSMPGNTVSAIDINRQLASCDSAALWLKSPKADVITNATHLNSSYTDWGAYSNSGQLCWVSDKPDASRKKHFLKFSNGNPVQTDQYGWTANNYLQLYTGSGNVVHLSPAKNSYHTGVPAIRKDGLEMFFTQTRYIRKPRKFLQQDSAYSIYIEIYSVSRATDTSAWSTPVPFRYNNALQYSVGDPFITADGKRLYFVSDMPGTTGGTDIYYCDRTGDNWSEAVKIGNEINTAGQERSPYIDETGTFYFSSDGHVGMGGLDIYQQEGDKAVNPGPPLNSPADDFYFMQEYFTSNRPGGQGSDDIYHFEKTKQETPVAVVVTKEPEKPKPLPNPLPVEHPIRLIIYYDFDKATIRKEAARDLDQLATVLKEKPLIQIRLTAHTDARGKKAYNLQLSQKRAQAALDYLVAKGIEKSRMTAQGFGEEKPVNGCKDGITCSETQHSENRRTAFEVLLK